MWVRTCYCHDSTALIHIDGSTLLITSEEHYFMQSMLDSIVVCVVCIVVLYWKQICSYSVQYFHTNTLVHHILKVEDAC